jgi:hypothetical protein
MGVARTMAMSDEAIVPMMNGRAPYSPATGFQSVPLRKPSPNWESACCELTRSRTRRRPSVATTAQANVAVIDRKMRSGTRDAARPSRRAADSTGTAGMGSTARWELRP